MEAQLTFEIVLVTLAIAFMALVYALILYFEREERKRINADARSIEAQERRRHRRQQAELAKPIEWPAPDAYLDPHKLEVRHEPGEVKTVVDTVGRVYEAVISYDANGKMLLERVRKTGVSGKAE